jgi:glycosyltransferase involved in cell wall biosynthesis
MITGMGYIFSDINPNANLVQKVAQKLLKIALHFNKAILFQNLDNLNTFRSNSIIPLCKKVAVINGSGVDIDWFYPVELPKSPVFLMIARLLVDKGIREYIQAAKIIKSRYPAVIFNLVGDIDTNPYSISQQELDQWIRDGTIIYLGQLPDVRIAISKSSIYVLPSYGEGTPRSSLEAMAMARPIITTDVPGCRETVTQNLNGLLVEVRNVFSLTNAMQYFIDNPNAIKKMGNASREIAEKKYDVHLVNQSILEALNID